MRYKTNVVTAVGNVLLPAAMGLPEYLAAHQLYALLLGRGINQSAARQARLENTSGMLLALLLLGAPVKASPTLLGRAPANRSAPTGVRALEGHGHGALGGWTPEG